MHGCIARIPLPRAMKILIVTTKSPYPLFEGRALRTYNLIKQAALHHEIHLLSFVQTPEDLEGIEHMRSICKVVEYEKLYFDGAKTQILQDAICELFSRAPLPVVKYRTAGMRAKMRKLMQTHQYDLVHLDMLHLADYMDLCGNTPVALIEHNVEHVILDRRADNETRPLHRAYLRYQAAKLKSYEGRACQRAQHVVAVSELDAQQLRDLGPGARVTSVPNGVDTEYFRTSQTPRKPTSLVFVGGFTWFPNLDAITYFCEDILPKLLKTIPDIQLTVIGKQPDTPVAQEIAKHPNVTLAGLVEDIRPDVDAAAAYIVPLRIGGGTRLKILDALSMSKAIISTSVGCEGLDVEDGKTIVIADTPDAFVQAIVKVLADPAWADTIGQQGRQLVESRYDWAAVAKTLMAVYADTAQRQAPRH
jgi:glycosyltransferase involved in cell wall biosynthesis